MTQYLIYGMVYLGSALMVYNIYGFISFAHRLKKKNKLTGKSSILYVPIVLLVMFLLGYLAVGIFGKPDLIVSGILFGGSIFVLIMYLLLCRITKRISESERLKAELMAAEESNRAKTNFLSGISHEMRTPMNVIIGLDTLAKKEPDLSGKMKTYLDKIGQSAEHLMGIIDNILDLNRIETGELHVKNEEFSLTDAIEQISAVTDTLCENKGLIYTVSGEELTTGRYKGDVMLIKQALVSMLDNAVKYTDAPGKVDLKIEKETVEENKEKFRFTVSDNGAGIDAEFLPHIFDAFAREDQSSTSRYSGSGLGLAVTKKIVDLLGGEITAESKKGEGSVFTVTLTFEKTAEKEAEQPTEEITLSGKRILIAEDLPENAEIVADLLDLEDALSEHAENGRIAVEMFSASEPYYYDAILMDLRMPELDGIGAAKEIRALHRPDSDVPIIALTANAFDSDVKQTIAAGMNAHLAKPADADLLYSTIKKHIGLRKRKGDNS